MVFSCLLGCATWPSRPTHESNWGTQNQRSEHGHSLAAWVPCDLVHGWTWINPGWLLLLLRRLHPLQSPRLLMLPRHRHRRIFVDTHSLGFASRYFQPDSYRALW